MCEMCCPNMGEDKNESLGEIVSKISKLRSEIAERESELCDLMGDYNRACCQRFAEQYSVDTHFNVTCDDSVKKLIFKGQMSYPGLLFFNIETNTFIDYSPGTIKEWIELGFMVAVK